jgi:negative regulator of sigma E activity
MTSTQLINENNKLLERQSVQRLNLGNALRQLAQAMYTFTTRPDFNVIRYQLT